MGRESFLCLSSLRFLLTQKLRADSSHKSILRSFSFQPVVRLQGRLCVFPGIPALFTSLLVALTPYLSLPPDTEKPYRHLIHTEMAESNIAPGLGKLAEEVRKEGIRVGSCELFFLSPPLFFDLIEASSLIVPHSRLLQTPLFRRE